MSRISFNSCFVSTGKIITCACHQVRYFFILYSITGQLLRRTRRKSHYTRYRAAVLTYNSGDFAAFFVTERNCAALPVAYRIGICHTRCSSVPQLFTSSFMSARKAIRYQCEHTVADPDLLMGEGGRVIQTERKGGGGSVQKIFFWSKNKGGLTPPGPSPRSATEIA